MLVNGLQLPTSLVQLIARPDLQPFFLMELKEEVDAYGNSWQADLQLWRDQESIEAETARVAEVLEQHAQLEKEQWAPNDKFAGEPGFIPSPQEGSQLVCFGTSAESDPFCLDFRDYPHEPSIIYWDDTYWRRVAPNFDGFIALFEPI